MSLKIRAIYKIIGVFLLVVLMSSLTAAKADPGPQTVVSVESLGMVTFETGTMFLDTEVGGLSGITYDSRRGVYYVISDDRSQNAPARFYTVSIDVSDGSLDEGDVFFRKVTFLRNKIGDLFPAGSLDPEGINLARNGQLYVSSEGDADAAPPQNPFVNRFNLAGKQNRALTIPDKFLPDGFETFGIRDNLAFESLTSSPNSRYLYTATENALHQDGPPSTLTDESPSRLLIYSLRNKRPQGEYVYMVNPIPFDSDPPGIFADNGLVELQALDNHGTFLAMERSFAVGVGNTVVLFETSLAGATEVSDLPALSGVPYTPMTKEYIADFDLDLGIDPDNLEGMTFGPTLPDGRILLIVVSDNNFNPGQTTQVIALAVELETVLE